MAPWRPPTIFVEQLNLSKEHEPGRAEREAGVTVRRFGNHGVFVGARWTAWPGPAPPGGPRGLSRCLGAGAPAGGARGLRATPTVRSPRLPTELETEAPLRAWTPSPDPGPCARPAPLPPVRPMPVGAPFAPRGSSFPVAAVTPFTARMVE